MPSRPRPSSPTIGERRAIGSKPKHPSKILELGQETDCIVIDLDLQNKRISLGLKQLEPDPWSVFIEKYNPGDVIRGKVRSITDYGVFVGIEDGVDGMVHKSDISWTQRVNNPADLYRKGDEVEAIILSVNEDDKKVSLGIKQLYEDPWNFIPQRYPEGTMLEVRIIAVDEFGAACELERGVEGVVPRAEISANLVDDPTQIVKLGQILKAQIIRLDHEERTVMCSLRNVENAEIDEKMKYVEAQGGVASPRAASRPQATLGDVLKAKLGGLTAAAAPAEADDEEEEDDEA